MQFDCFISLQLWPFKAVTPGKTEESDSDQGSLFGDEIWCLGGQSCLWDFEIIWTAFADPTHSC